MQLKKASLSVLANQRGGNIGIPAYDPSDLKPGIAHVGVGNFFRAHPAFHLHELFNKAAKDESMSNADREDIMRWGIVGGAVTDHSYSDRRDTLKHQDMMYTLVERNDDCANSHVVASVIDCLEYKEDLSKSPLKENLTDPSIRIVSLTVTEGGYFLKDGEFDPENEMIRNDIENPDKPKTIFGLIVQALDERRKKDIQPFTVMSCDNVPGNGDIAKSVVLGLAKEIDADLGEYIEKNACFPNSMVDRITPSTTEEMLEFLKDEYNFEDGTPVFCEPFKQWVLEDSFVNNDRPPLDKVGVRLVDDVTPWENMKLRILNGGHASLSYPAALLGLEYVHEAAEHETIGKFLDCLQRTEIIPIVNDVPDTDLSEYWETVQKRYKNPTLKDSIDRNCEDGSDRQPKFIVPPIRANLEEGNDVDGLALVSAMWCRYCLGETEDGTEIEPNDQRWDELTELAEKAKEDPVEWLKGVESVYGDLAENDKFVEAFEKQLKIVNEEGVEKAMQQYIDSVDKKN